MSAPAAALAWTTDFRKAVITKVVEAVNGDESKRAAVQSACGLQSGQNWASADEAIAAFDAAGWMAPERDLDELLTKLAAAGAYPASLTGYRWDWSCSALQSLAAEAVARSQRVLDGIAALKDGAHTFANTFGLLNSNDRIVDLWSTNVSFLGHVSADKAVRDAATELTKALSEFEVSQGMRVDLFQSVVRSWQCCKRQRASRKHAVPATLCEMSPVTAWLLSKSRTAIGMRHTLKHRHRRADSAGRVEPPAWACAAGVSG